VISIIGTFMGGQLLEELAATLPERAGRGVADAARDLRDEAAARAPYDTGSLAASIYVATPQGSDYDERAGEAAALNPKVVLLPEVERPGPGEAVVGVAAEHGLYLEYGTRYMPAQPFLTPAADAARQAVTEHVAARLEMLVGGKE
jgi:HK97 gp10 family phage protein